MRNSTGLFLSVSNFLTALKESRNFHTLLVRTMEGFQTFSEIHGKHFDGFISTGTDQFQVILRNVQRHCRQSVALKSHDQGVRQFLVFVLIYFVDLDVGGECADGHETFVVFVEFQPVDCNSFVVQLEFNHTLEFVGKPQNLEIGLKHHADVNVFEVVEEEQN